MAPYFASASVRPILHNHKNSNLMMVSCTHYLYCNTFYQHAHLDGPKIVWLPLRLLQNSAITTNRTDSKPLLNWWGFREDQKRTKRRCDCFSMDLLLSSNVEEEGTLKIAQKNICLLVMTTTASRPYRHRAVCRQCSLRFTNHETCVPVVKYSCRVLCVCIFYTLLIPHA